MKLFCDKKMVALLPMLLCGYTNAMYSRVVPHREEEQPAALMSRFDILPGPQKPRTAEDLMKDFSPLSYGNDDED